MAQRTEWRLRERNRQAEATEERPKRVRVEGRG
jgi:hypothetical protein